MSQGTIMFAAGKVGQATAWLEQVSEERWYIGSIRVRDDSYGQGLGRRLLTEVCRWADRHELELELIVLPSHSSPMDDEALEAWYGRYGFTAVAGSDEGLMRRAAREWVEPVQGR